MTALFHFRFIPPQAVGQPIEFMFVYKTSVARTNVLATAMVYAF